MTAVKPSGFAFDELSIRSIMISFSGFWSWSEPNSGKRDSGSDELSSGEIGQSSDFKSREARQPQLADTEVVMSF